MKLQPHNYNMWLDTSKGPVWSEDQNWLSTLICYFLNDQLNFGAKKLWNQTYAFLRCGNFIEDIKTDW